MASTPRVTRSLLVRGLLWISRGSFAITFLLVMITRSWESGLFAQLPLYRFHIGGQAYLVGALTILPALAGSSWALARWAERLRGLVNSVDSEVA